MSLVQKPNKTNKKQRNMILFEQYFNHEGSLNKNSYKIQGLFFVRRVLFKSITDKTVTHESKLFHACNMCINFDIAHF